MSAIWGIIDLNRKPVANESAERMRAPYRQCRLDRTDERKESHVYMGCGHQFTDKESETQVLPFVDLEQGIYFTGDVYLFNRTQVRERLGCKQTDQYGDAELLLRAFQVWGTACLKWIYGVYSFVYYDDQKGEITVAADHTSSRVLYYKIEEDRFYFSTLINPVIFAMNGEFQWNEHWISDFLCQDSYRIVTDCSHTFAEGILKMEPGCFLRADKGGSDLMEYWRPERNLFGRFHGRESEDQFYQQKFLQTYQKAVQESLRTDQEVGILLSGGLDSTSVAVLAAAELQKQNKSLYSYTSVPEKGYRRQDRNFTTADESRIVEMTVEQMKNIIPSYIDAEGKDGWNSVPQLQEILELPYKAMQNMVWIQDSYQQAAQDGCRIVLNGQYGNATVSNGSFEMMMYTYFRNFQWKQLLHEIRMIQKKHGVGRKSMLKYLLGSLHHNKAGDDLSELKKCLYLSETMMTVTQTDEHLVDINELNLPHYQDFSCIQEYIYDKKALSHIGEYETKLSLMTGVLVLDPTRHPSIIELCLNLPLKCFVSEGVNRRLIRGYMKDLLPAFHSRKIFFSGIQSGDMSDRIKNNWQRIKTELESTLDSDKSRRWLDIQKIMQDIQNMPDQMDQADQEDFPLARILYHEAMMKFIQNQETKIKEKSLQNC